MQFPVKHGYIYSRHGAPDIRAVVIETQGYSNGRTSLCLTAITKARGVQPVQAGLNWLDADEFDAGMADYLRSRGYTVIPPSDPE